jgi:hypothetical protein
LVLQLAVLYHGTRFQTARYFLPALAVFWIFLSPFLWLLLEKFLWARFAVLANALILTASVWSADFAKAANQVSGYPTFLSLSAIQTGQLAKKSIESSPSYQREPIVYVLGIDMSAEVVSRQLALEAGWEEKVVWKYGPRFWEKHSPSIHPHEIASADFLVTDAGISKFMENDLFKALSETIKFFNASDGIWEAPVLGQVESITVRKIADQPALEKRLAAHLQKQGLLHFQEVGPSLESIPGEASLASFESGDELVSAHAKWVGDKLQVAATWSGSRDLKRHLQASVALVDSRGVPIHWIPLSLVAPPTSADGLRYRRTIVDDLDCGPFAEKASGVTLGIYDLTNKCLVRPLTSSTPPIYDRIPVPFMGSSENSKAQSP